MKGAHWLTTRLDLVKSLGVLTLMAGLCLAAVPQRQVPRGAGASLASRLFGPIASLAASIQWVRADLAFRQGRLELFLARAQVALTLAPDAGGGWRYLAWHQAFHLASIERESDPTRRLAWVRAALATAAEGERVAADPGDLAMLSGEIVLKCALGDPELPWPGGSAELWEQAAAHFERAMGLGYDAALAGALANSARAQAKLERDQ